jgi:hypothetical protein
MEQRAVEAASPRLVADCVDGEKVLRGAAGSRLPGFGAVFGSQQRAGVADRQAVGGVEEGNGVESDGSAGIVRGPGRPRVGCGVDQPLFAEQVGRGGSGRSGVAQIAVLRVGRGGQKGQHESCRESDGAVMVLLFIGFR